MPSMQGPKDEGAAFRVSGRVTEAESGLGVPGLIVRSFDKDMLFDDLLGSVITSSDGSFEIRYLRSYFGGLFEAKSDIYLSVYAPPLRWLADTKESVRRNAGVDERFSIVLDRDVLGPHSPATPADRVESRLKLPSGALKIVDRAGFDFPVLPGFKTHGVPSTTSFAHEDRVCSVTLRRRHPGCRDRPGPARPPAGARKADAGPGTRPGCRHRRPRIR